VSDPFKACAAAVRKHDPDRYFSALFAPADKRPLLFALYAFNHELAHVGESVREPMIGEIRLQWWRETLESARAGNPRPHDVARAMAATFAATALPQELFDAMIDARSFDLMSGTFDDDTKRDAYFDATSGNLMRLAARILGAGDRFDEHAREAGIAYGLAGLLRNQAHRKARSFLAAGSEAGAARDAQSHLARAKRLPKPGRAIAAFLPASLVPLYLRDSAKDVPLHRRQLRLLSAALRGRI
jgi:phytoene synthase